MKHSICKALCLSALLYSFTNASESGPSLNARSFYDAWSFVRLETEIFDLEQAGKTVPDALRGAYCAKKGYLSGSPIALLEPAAMSPREDLTQSVIVKRVPSPDYSKMTREQLVNEIERQERLYGSGQVAHALLKAHEDRISLKSVAAGPLKSTQAESDAVDRYGYDQLKDYEEAEPSNVRTPPSEGIYGDFEESPSGSRPPTPSHDQSTATSKWVYAAEAVGVAAVIWTATEAVFAYKNIPKKEWDTQKGFLNKLALVAKKTGQSMYSRPQQGVCLARNLLNKFRSK